MIKKSRTKIAMIFFLSVVLNFPSISQTPKYFIISGKILSELASNESSSIKITKNNKKSVFSKIPEHGRFRLELEYHTEYELTFNKKGYLSKTIVINTEIPEKTINSSSNLPHFFMAVQLFSISEDSEYPDYATHIQRISYSIQKECFTRQAKAPEVEYVEKGKSHPDSGIQSHENKIKMQEYQLF